MSDAFQPPGKTAFNVMVICEPEFNRAEPTPLLAKIAEGLSEQYDSLELQFQTVSGKYGIRAGHEVHEAYRGLVIHDIEDRTKTTFVDCVENLFYDIDLLVIFGKHNNSVLNAVLSKSLDHHISGKVYGY